MRLIDADALHEKITEIFNDKFDNNDIVEWRTHEIRFAIDEQPTVNALHVINCRECRWLKTNEFYTYCPITKHYGLDSNTYCCWAERKEE